MNQEEEKRDITKDITEAWNQAEELSTSFEELDGDDLVYSRNDLQARAKKIMELLSSYVDNDYLEEINQ